MARTAAAKPHAPAASAQAKLLSLEASAAALGTDAAPQPLPCEPMGPATAPHASATTQSVASDGTASMGGTLAPSKSAKSSSLGPTNRLTPDRYHAAVEAVASGIRRHAALVLAGVPSRTADFWLSILNGRTTRWPDGSTIAPEVHAFLARLAQDFARAEAERERQVVENIVKAAESVNEKTGIPEWRAGAWLLEHGPAWKRDYAEYREQRIEHAGTIDHNLRQVQQMTDVELLEAAPAEWRELWVVTDSEQAAS